MPNLTSYHPPILHLHRELPKNYCDLIQHEFDYNHFLRTRLTRGRTSVDCHNENYKERLDISHFRLRQNHWKEKIESENQRFIHSLLYHRQTYRSAYDRSTTRQAFEEHLRLLKNMSQYSKYRRNNSICRNLFNRKYIQFNQPKLPIIYKQIKTNKYFHRSNAYVQNIVQQTLNSAISIYNQPLPSAPNRLKSSYSDYDQQVKRRAYHPPKLVRSVSCQLSLKPWRHRKQRRGSLENHPTE